MKKLSLIFLLTLSASFVFGQFSFGPKIGYNTSKLTTDLDDVSSDLSNNFQFGAFARFGTKIYIQPEVNWLTLGGTFSKPQIGVGKGIKQEVDMKSIEIPLILGWRIINLGLGNIRILAGPSASIVTETTVSTTDGDSFINPITSADIEDLVWGFNVGGGVDILMFTLDVRYQFGLNDIITTVEEFDFNSKNNMFAVSLGWKIL
ncbi:MAG: PorT family protein [Bacteroidales bacterium]|nr:PorT family protein [Bacteroidales bacterium]